MIPQLGGLVSSNRKLNTKYIVSPLAEDPWVPV